MPDKKALLLFSGGLDSILSAKVLKEQGLEITALHFYNLFEQGSYEEKKEELEQICQKLGINLTIRKLGDEYLDVIKDPSHNYGSEFNPCIDCRIHLLKRAKSIMEEEDYDFIATGEVVGQRPMSQKKHMIRHIEKESDLADKVVRPLTAKLLWKSYTEREGVVDRDSLLDISGRSRKEQMKLAREYGIQNYPAPAGGCLLTDPNFAQRIKELSQYKPDFSIKDARLLKFGRHFRVNPEYKVIVGRDEEENDKLRRFAENYYPIIMPQNKPGPSGVITTNTYEKINSEYWELCGGIVARYMSVDEDFQVEYEIVFNDIREGFQTTPVSPSQSEEYLIK